MYNCLLSILFPDTSNLSYIREKKKKKIAKISKEKFRSDFIAVPGNMARCLYV